MNPVTLRLACSLLVSTLALSATPLRAEAVTKEDVPPSVLKRYDKNKNGTLEEAELAKWEAEKEAAREKKRAARAALLEKFDTDKNGKLSEVERAEAKLAMQEENTAREAERLKARAEKLKAEQAAAKSGEEAKEKAAGMEGDKMMDGEKMMDGDKMMAE